MPLSRVHLELQVILETSQILVAQAQTLVQASQQLRELVSADRRVFIEHRQERADARIRVAGSLA